MRTAGIHLHQPPSPVTAANQQQRDGAIMWAEGSNGNDRLASRRNNTPDNSNGPDMNFRWVRTVSRGRAWGVKFGVGS